MGLEGRGGRVVSTLSGGQKRRLDVAMGLVHRPELLFLDEPSTGLDPQNRANLAEQIRKLRQEHGTTIFFTTHYLEEADQLAERVIVIDQGEVIADDTPEALKTNLAGDLISVSTREQGDAQRAAAVAARIGKAHDTTVEPGVLKLRVTEGPALMPRLLAALGADGIEVTAAEIRRPTLDDVFLTLTGRSLRESNG
jgi:ABC-2 type transport system ATP-binding protein